MPLATPAHKVGSSVGGLSSVPTASWTPVNNRLYLLAVVNRLASGGGAGNTPTASGNGMTWVQVGAPVIVTSGITWKITFFRAMVASGAAAGATTIDFAGQSQSRVIWSIDEYDGAQMGGTNGDTAIVQSNSNLGPLAGSGFIALAAFGAAGNGSHACFVHATAEATTQESGWTELLDDSGSGAGTEVEGRNSSDNSPSATWSTSSAWAGLAVEIQANLVALSPASVVHTRVTPGGVKVSPNLAPLSVVHTRVLNAGTKLLYAVSPAPVVHTRSLSPAPTLFPSVVPASVVHTRVTQAPRLARNLAVGSLAHVRVISPAPRLNPTLMPLSLVHARGVGSPLNVYPGPPPVIPYFRSFGRFPDWWFDPVRVHK